MAFPLKPSCNAHTGNVRVFFEMHITLTGNRKRVVIPNWLKGKIPLTEETVFGPIADRVEKCRRSNRPLKSASQPGVETPYISNYGILLGVARALRFFFSFTGRAKAVADSDVPQAPRLFYSRLLSLIRFFAKCFFRRWLFIDLGATAFFQFHFSQNFDRG